MSRKRRFSLRGKQILLLGLTALVITAGYYRWTVETEKYQSVAVAGESLPVQGEGESTEQEVEEKNLNRLKQERDRARSESVEEWKKLAESSEAGVDSKREAEQKIKTANENSEREKTIETLVKAKGYEDCFVKIGDGSITVRVSGGEVNGSKVAQIKDIVVSETGAEVRNIKISAE